MADNHAPAVVDNDYVEHEKSYALFTKMIKWGTVLSLGILVFAGAATSILSWAFALIVIALMVGVAVFM